MCLIIVSPRLPIISLLLLSALPQCSGYPTGAATCDVSFASVYYGMGGGRFGNGGYSLATSYTAYVPGELIEVTIKGPAAIKGLLVTSAIHNSVYGEPTRVGSFSESEFVKLLDCGGDNSTVTHRSSVDKPLPFTLSWRSPSSVLGPITFKAVVAVSRSEWNVLEPVVFYPDPNSGPSPPIDPPIQASGEVLTLTPSLGSTAGGTWVTVSGIWETFPRFCRFGEFDVPALPKTSSQVVCVSLPFRAPRVLTFELLDIERHYLVPPLAFSYFLPLGVSISPRTGPSDGESVVTVSASSVLPALETLEWNCEWNSANNFKMVTRGTLVRDSVLTCVVPLAPSGVFAVFLVSSQHRLNPTPALYDATCSPGHRLPTRLDNTSGPCVPCPIGDFSSHWSVWNCTACAPGFYASYTGLSSCFPCVPGHFAHYSGATTCYACPSHLVAHEFGMTSCHECPQHSYVFNASAGCLCSEGYVGIYINDTRAVPTVCSPAPVLELLSSGEHVSPPLSFAVFTLSLLCFVFEFG